MTNQLLINDQQITNQLTLNSMTLAKRLPAALALSLLSDCPELRFAEELDLALLGPRHRTWVSGAVGEWFGGS